MREENQRMIAITAEGEELTMILIYQVTRSISRYESNTVYSGSTPIDGFGVSHSSDIPSSSILSINVIYTLARTTGHTRGDVKNVID